MDLKPDIPGAIAVPNDQIPMVVTYLEMTAKPEIENIESNLQLVSWPAPAAADYLSLFRKVGEPWLWASRLYMDEATLFTQINHPDVDIYIVEEGNRFVGMLELDFRERGQCEIAFFGLVPEMAGGGHGRWLMSETLRKAWRKGIQRVWLHTCTADSPKALPFYMRSGFSAYKRELEMMADPRLTGHLPRDAAPHIPLIS
ncbi:Acetyltransferase (GNAT) domain-containing protein [Parasphingorhabdus marina DSM 22363]|uniref:Acetyltransferase (GNAT) domain-containing protein n=1 Tax=Parasphingorhabdus marina DSM 22363 TaxID=1123272 RepID=A0A1N6F5F0_9SPHN|nr:GNAT family N-acetyltransferase [Parasphingorhabdus marina]SIN90503.1 Acetyltransferase (GNAT) domain-containing protein [Parasphingorhabdus marina DSM 22363]